jgi:nitrilase
VLFGGVPVAEGAAVLNAALLYGPDGRLLARYDKIHLFQLDPAKPSGIDETRWYTPGSEPVAVTLNGWKIGLSICYDLRFPELYRHYAPADLLVCTAAFTEATGRAHWEVLLRARAIENQCFMAGVGQCGTNPETGQTLFGHTCLVDPWGEEVVAVPGGTEGLAVTALARTRLDEVRARLPALQHRRLQ